MSSPFTPLLLQLSVPTTPQRPKQVAVPPNAPARPVRPVPRYMTAKPIPFHLPAEEVDKSK